MEKESKDCKASYHNYGIKKFGFCAKCNGEEHTSKEWQNI